ncbi:MAG: caspase family protein [Rhodovibrionaceae bacterium]
MFKFFSMAGVLSAFVGSLLLPSAALAAETDSGVYVELRDENAPDAEVTERWKFYGASHALIIGIDDYDNGWPRLSNAVKDAKAVAEELEGRGFEVTTLLDPTGDELRAQLRSFFALRGADPEARLFVWFAGHGYTEFGEGYLVPADAPDPSNPEFRLTALHMGDVGSMVRIARSKHVYAVFDSCFAGTIFNASRARPPAAITRAVAEPVRQFLTSGDADQEVSDDGTFRSLFLKALRGDEDADANDDGYLTGSELSLYLEDRVINLTNSAQTPRSGKLRDQRFDQGDFVFLLPRDEEEVQVAALDEEAPAGEAGTRALPNPNPDLAVELAFWDSIKASDSIADYQAYLTAYPDGRFSVLAEARLTELEARVARIEAEQARAREEEARQEEEAAAQRAAAQEQARLAEERAKIAEEKARLAEEARRIAEEKAAREAAQETQVAALPEQPQVDPAEQDELALNLNRSDRRELQQALVALGYDTRGIDGFFGPGTRNAIRQYQAAKGAAQTGYLTASLASGILSDAPKPEPEPEPQPVTAQPAPEPQPAQTQTAALPPEPVVSKDEVESYVASNEGAVTEMFVEYNNRYRLLKKHDSRLPRKVVLGAFRVKEIEQDEIVASVRLSERSNYMPQTLTKDFLLKWTGGGFEIIGYREKWELRRTGG